MEKIGGNARIRKIAVTGLLSSGKSTVCDIFAESGAHVIKSDDIVHKLLSSDAPTIEQVTQTFGLALVAKGGIDRKVLAQLVFEKADRLKALEMILHPKVVASIKETYQIVKKNLSYKAFVVEIPLLFKLSSFRDWFDVVIYVTREKSLCQESFVSRGFSNEDFEKRWNLFPMHELSDIVIENNGSIDHLRNQIQTLL